MSEPRSCGTVAVQCARCGGPVAYDLVLAETCTGRAAQGGRPGSLPRDDLRLPMTAHVMGLEATRAELRGELIKAEAAVQKAADSVGAVALRAVLGAVTRCELEVAESAHIVAGARVAELRGALEALAGREADHREDGR